MFALHAGEFRAAYANHAGHSAQHSSIEQTGEKSMQTGHELFIHGMSDILDAERQLVEALQQLDNDSTNSQLKKAFASHRKETEKQAERLQQCFKLLGEEPEESECAGIKGIIQEKKNFMEEDPAEDILDVFHVGAAIKTETYEICEYESLIDMAREMKHAKVAQLLGQNLKEEKAALKKMEGFEKKIKPNEMMNEEQRERSRSASGPKRKKAA
jgi:ferritin-like metal-binding protein YciE